MPAINSIAQGLAIALYFEEKSYEYYTEKYQELQNNLFKDILQFLANQEKDHIARIEELKAALLKKKIIKKENFKVDQTMFNPITEITDKSHEVEILLMAMAFEKRAKEFYANEEKKTKIKELKNFYSDMTKFEESHYKLLEGLYESFMYVRLES
jgi:rubrerythrin